MQRKPSIKNSRTLILNGESEADRRARRLCLKGLQAALDAVEPYTCVESQLKVVGNNLNVHKLSLDLSRFRRIFLLAVGKASLQMANATIGVLDDYSVEGIVVAPRDQRAPIVDRRLRAFFSGHPIPDREGWNASKQVVRQIKGMRQDELLVCLLSGGASALLPSPAHGIGLRDKNRLTQQLIRTGASIHEINTVRRHISKLKGGKLVDLCPASGILSLLISDVPGNQLHDIGSGLTAEDPTTYRDAVTILKRHNIWRNAPTKIKSHLIQGIKGTIPETPKPSEHAFKRVHNIIIADNQTACNAIRNTLRSAGLKAEILSTSIETDARRLGLFLATAAKEMRTHPPRTSRGRAVIVGGETTVRVSGEGRGGRNQEVALSGVSVIAGSEGSAVATMGTDGVDGNSDAAGAIIDGNTFLRAKRRTIDLVDFSQRNDSHTFFAKLGDALFTGPTGTNVGDVYLALSVS